MIIEAKPHSREMKRLQERVARKFRCVAHILEREDREGIIWTQAMSNDLAKIQADLDIVQRHYKAVRPLINSSGALSLVLNPETTGALRQIAQDFARSRHTWEQFRQSGALERIASVPNELIRLQRSFADYNSRFLVPQATELAHLFKELEATTLKPLCEQFGVIRSAMEAMRTPWLDFQNQLRSLGGFAELQNIGLALKNLPAFAKELGNQIRVNLGDWRLSINWPKAIFSDPIARTEFYAARGLDLRLTDFPREAFQEGAKIAGLIGDLPPLFEPYQGAQFRNEEEEGLERTNAAHEVLLRFETHLRKFIVETMTATFGSNWIRQRVPGEIWQGWETKRNIARDRGEKEWPLIAYADFTDYVTIITKTDNWEVAFKPIFRRAEFVKESFQRLYPIRLCTMHARIITQDDELYLYVETKRLLTAIGFKI